MARNSPYGPLRSYRFWGSAAVASFILFLVLLSWTLMKEEGAYYGRLVAVFFSGLLWIGSTSLSRHSFILLKGCLGKKVSMPEFLSTQFVCVLFPFVYRRVRREAEEIVNRES